MLTYLEHILLPEVFRMSREKLGPKSIIVTEPLPPLKIKGEIAPSNHQLLEAGKHMVEIAALKIEAEVNADPNMSAKDFLALVKDYQKITLDVQKNDFLEKQSAPVTELTDEELEAQAARLEQEIVRGRD